MYTRQRDALCSQLMLFVSSLSPLSFACRPIIQHGTTSHRCGHSMRRRKSTPRNTGSRGSSSSSSSSSHAYSASSEHGKQEVGQKEKEKEAEEVVEEKGKEVEEEVEVIDQPTDAGGNSENEGEDQDETELSESGQNEVDRSKGGEKVSEEEVIEIDKTEVVDSDTQPSYAVVVTHLEEIKKSTEWIRKTNEDLMSRVEKLEKDQSNKLRSRSSTRVWMEGLDLTKPNTAPKL